MIPETNVIAIDVNRDFRETFNKYYPNVCRQLTYLVGDPSAAEDLAQETFVKLLETPPDDRGNIGGWLAKVAANLAYNYMRSGRRRADRESREIGETMGQVIPLDEAVAHRMEVREVRAALERLAPRDRACLLLKHSGYSYAEIASVVGVPATSVGTILARALEHFRRVYESRE